MIIATCGSLNDYWHVERRTEYKNEYIDGQVISRISVSGDHSRITMNLGLALRERALGQGWREMLGFRVIVRQTGAHVWPDACVFEGDGEFEIHQQGDDESLLNPVFIAEVFSPDTELLDRGAKFAHYRSIPSVREYVLISQSSVGIERFVRHGDGWLYTAQTEIDGTLPLDSLGCSIPIREIYHGVEVPSRRTSMLIPPVEVAR
jgi:Uma2 family endonuclease